MCGVPLNQEVPSTGAGPLQVTGGLARSCEDYILTMDELESY